MSDLNMTKMDFFKTVVDGKLVNIEEASCEMEGFKDASVNNSIPEAQEDEPHEV